jgi:hypothetical protein
MDRSLVITTIGVALITQIWAVGAQSQQIAGSHVVVEPKRASSALSLLPASPQGRSTILGGVIQDVDRVRDQFRLQVYGQRAMTILFDERTGIYLDGKPISLRALSTGDHGSVQTVLDGTNVFAVSIHLQSRSPQGEYQGQVLNYNAATRTLTISSVLSREPFTLFVPSNTPITRAGQMALHSGQAVMADIVKGTLVSLTFESDRKGGGVASGIVILASPGSTFVFGGDLSSIDSHSGILVLVDSRDNKSYDIVFDSAILPLNRTLHAGDNIRVTTTYDGSRYVANEIAVN